MVTVVPLQHARHLMPRAAFNACSCQGWDGWLFTVGDWPSCLLGLQRTTVGTSRALGGWPSGCHRQGLAAMLCFSVYLLPTGAWYRLTQQGLAMWLVILPSMLLPAIL